MRLMIVPEWFAPKIDDIKSKIHCIYFLECNFKCTFCSQSKRKQYVKVSEYDKQSFRKEVTELIKASRFFKLTGGEPSINKDIIDVVQIINECGGEVLFDTNGSSTAKTKELIDKGYIKVLGVSIKGLNPEEAMRKAGGISKERCWDNVIDLCNYAYTKPIVILTYVVDSSTNHEDVLHFCKKILDGEIKVDYFKINNLYGRDLPDNTLSPMDLDKLIDLLKNIAETYPQLKDRLIGIPDFGAVRNEEVIMHY